MQENKDLAQSNQSLTIKYVEDGLIVILHETYCSIIDAFRLHTVGKVFQTLK